jgi:TolB-like protein
VKTKVIGVFCALLFIPITAFSQAVTLDTALRNSTTYLNGRIQAKTKVVVLNFTSKWPELSDYIIDELIGYVVNDGNLAVVDRNNLETIRKELNFQLSGEVSDETAQSIGKMLGAQTIINGNITAIGNAYRLRVRAISVESAQIIGMNNVDVAQDSRIAALTGTASVVPVAVMPVTPTNTPTTTTTPTKGDPMIVLVKLDNNPLFNNGKPLTDKDIAMGRGWIVGDQFKMVMDAKEGSFIRLTCGGTGNLHWETIGAVGVKNLGNEQKRINFRAKNGGIYTVDIDIIRLLAKIKGENEAIGVNIWGGHVINKVELYLY